MAFDYASRDELLACLDHLLESAGNPSLVTSELRGTLADHAAGNDRVMMNLGDELLAVAAERELARLDENLCLEVFAHTRKPKLKLARKRERRQLRRSSSVPDAAPRRSRRAEAGPAG